MKKLNSKQKKGILITGGMTALFVIGALIVSRTKGYAGTRTPLYKRPNKQTFVETQAWRKHWKSTKNTYAIDKDYLTVY